MKDHLVTSATYRRKLEYRPDIDGIRAIAVLFVVIFHAFPDTLRGGFIGVDIFFVLSGFLISRIVFTDIENQSFSFSDFYARRILRIFPALLIVLVSSLLIGWLILLSNEYKQLGKHSASAASFISNFILWEESGYFDSAAERKPLLHLWSLSIEEQFYLFFPLILWLAWRRNLNLLAVTIFIAFFSFFLNIGKIENDLAGAFYSPQTRIWELLCGSVLAWFSIYKKSQFQNVRLKIDDWLGNSFYRVAPPNNGQTLSNSLSFIGLLFLLFGAVIINKIMPFPSYWALIPVMGTLLIISAGPHAWINRKILSTKKLVWLGLISYPLYLWHWPLLAFINIVEETGASVSLRAGVVGLSIFLAWLTYRVIERPTRNGNHKKIKAFALTSLMIATGFAGFSIYKENGYPHRLKSLHELGDIISDPLPAVTEYSCKAFAPELAHFDFNGGCSLSQETSPDILILGDSHAAHYKNAAWRAFPDKSVLMISETSCLPFSNSKFLSGHCREKNSATLNYIERTQSIKTVILAGHWAYLMSGSFGRKGQNWRISQEPTAEQIRTFKENASHFLTRATNTKKRIIFLHDTPDLDLNIKLCFDGRPFRITPLETIEDCSINEKEYLARMQIYDNEIADLLSNFPEIKTFNPRPLFCKDGRCTASDGALPYYYDGDHLNRHGAELVISSLRETLIDPN